MKITENVKRDIKNKMKNPLVPFKKFNLAECM